MDQPETAAQCRDGQAIESVLDVGLAVPGPGAEAALGLLQLAGKRTAAPGRSRRRAPRSASAASR